MDHPQPPRTSVMEHTASISIQDLPEEMILHIAQFLSPEDIYACLNVCHQWRLLLNSDIVWKKYCIYSEKHFKGECESRMQKLALKNDYKEWCPWRKYYKLQKKLWENWSDGLFVIENFDIGYPVNFIKDFVDDYGNYWLFAEHSNGKVSICNITGTPRLHSEVELDFKTFPFQPYLFNNKLLLCDYNYADVYQFKPPEFELKLDYQFRYEDDFISDRKLTADDSERTAQVKYCCTLVDQFFLICSEEVVNIQEAFLHVWDLESGQKVCKQNVFQESDFDILTASKTAAGSLKLFGGHSKLVLFSLVPSVFESYDLCLFSLEDMKIVKVIATVIGTIDCKIKGSLILIFIHHSRTTSFAWLYNINGHKLQEYSLPGDYTYVMENNCFLSEYSVILKVTKQKVHITSITGSKELRENEFNVEFGLYITYFHDPNLLFMCNPFFCDPELSVWDTDKGEKLWQFSSPQGAMMCFVDPCGACPYNLYRSAYPYKMIVPPNPQSTQFRILNFEENVDELSRQGRRRDSRIYISES